MTDNNDLRKTGLPREYFVSDEIFQRETEHVFSRNWVCAAHLSEFPPPPSFRVVEVGSYSIVVARTSSDDLHAFHNVCRHRGARLCQETHGPIKNSAFVCPYHAWTYDVQGRLLNAPHMRQQPHFDRGDYPLAPVAAVNWHGFVMLHLRETNSSFAAAHQPLQDRLANWSLGSLTLAETLRYQVRANWKMLFQNYSECYHCPTVHPALSRLTPYKSATNDLTSGGILGGPMELDQGVETISADGKLVAPRFPRLTAEQAAHVYYYTVFPTLFVSAHPDYVMVHVLHRRAPSLTEVACHFLTLNTGAGPVNAGLSSATQLWDEVNQQDWRVCELTQLGVQSPAFRPGPYSGLESMVRAFDRHYLEAMKSVS